MKPWIAGILLLAAGCAAPPSGEPRASADPLRVVDMQGGTHDIDAALARGENVALVFWQTWCESCKREAPALANAARTFGERIRFLGIIPGRDESVDDAEVTRLAQSFGFPYPQVRDRDLSLSQRFGVEGTPTIIVLGRGGAVLFRGHRPPGDWSAFRGEPLARESSSPGATTDAEPGAACEDGVCPIGEPH